MNEINRVSEKNMAQKLGPFIELKKLKTEILGEQSAE